MVDRGELREAVQRLLLVEDDPGDACIVEIEAGGHQWMQLNCERLRRRETRAGLCCRPRRQIS